MHRLLLTIWFSLAALLLYAPSASAATVRVPGDYSSIREAVQNSADGDTVVVDAGQYEDNIVINRPVTLKSASGADSTTVRAADPLRPVIEVKDTTWLVVSGFTLTGSKKAGISITRTTAARVTANHADRNASGILLFSTTGSTLANNTADLNDTYGIYLEKSSGNSLINNTANRNRDRGIFLSYSDRNLLRENKANLNAWNGITIWVSNNNIIEDNITLRNTYGIVEASSKGNRLTGNTTLPNVYLILPVVLVYIGIVLYLIQKAVLRYLYRGMDA